MSGQSYQKLSIKWGFSHTKNTLGMRIEGFSDGSPEVSKVANPI